MIDNIGQRQGLSDTMVAILKTDATPI